MEMSNTKQFFLAIGVSSLILGFIFGMALVSILVANGMAEEAIMNIPEFQNCHTSSDGHTMCQ